MNLDRSKKTIPVKVLKGSIETILPYVSQLIDHMLENNIFPGSLKLADVKPVHKKGDTTYTGNFRPISLLPTLSKIFERIICDQLNAHFESIFLRCSVALERATALNMHSLNYFLHGTKASITRESLVLS